MTCNKAVMVVLVAVLALMMVVLEPRQSRLARGRWGTSLRWLYSVYS